LKNARHQGAPKVIGDHHHIKMPIFQGPWARLDVGFYDLAVLLCQSQGFRGSVNAGALVAQAFEKLHVTSCAASQV
jgi:hypothetical protein